MVIPYLLNHHSSIQKAWITSPVFACVLVAVYQQRKCSITCTTDLNLCTVCRFGVYHLSKKWKLLKMFSVLQQNLFLTTMYQITELVSFKLHILPLSMLHELNDTCFFFCQIPQQASNSFTITDYVSLSGNNTRSGSHHKLVQPMHGNNQSFKTLLL